MARTAFDEGSEDWGRCLKDLERVINTNRGSRHRSEQGVPPLEEFSRLNGYVHRRVASLAPDLNWTPQDTREVLTALLSEVADDDHVQHRELVVAKTLVGLRETPGWDDPTPNPLSADQHAAALTLGKLEGKPYLPKTIDFVAYITVRRAYVAPLYRPDSIDPTTFSTKPWSPIWQVTDEVLRALLARIEEVARAQSEQGIPSDAAIGLTLSNTAGDKPALSTETSNNRTESAGSHWYDQEFEDRQTEERVRAFTQELIETVPRAIKEGRETLAGTPLLEVHTVQELLERFDLLTEISNSLDRFAPTVFEQDLDELKQTTDTRSRPESLRSLLWDRSTPTGAWAYVRPGVRIEDMDAALAKLQAQKAAWRDMAQPFTFPRIPVGVSQAKAQMQAARKALEQLDGMLDRTDDESLVRLPFEEVTQGLYRLAAGGK